MLKSLNLIAVGPAPRMVFEPADRLNVITGDNGLGKSFLLDLAWWAVTRTWAGHRILPPQNVTERPQVEIEFRAVSKTASLTAVFDRSHQEWKFPKGKPGQPGLVVYARVDGDFAVWDSNRRFGGVDEERSGVPSGLVFQREDVWNGLKRDEKPICNGLLQDWVAWQQTKSWEFKVLERALRTLSPAESERIAPGRPVRVDVLDSRLIPTIGMPYRQDVPLTVASAGMKRIVALAYLLVWAWREHLEVSEIAGRATAERMLVIIDEIESHLHPKWQRLILSSLVEALEVLTRSRPSNHPKRKPPKIQYIVATHSPLVLTSIEALFDETKDALFELQLQENGHVARPRVTLETAIFTRKGSAEQWLVSDVFGLKTSRPLPAEELIQEAADLINGHDPNSRALDMMERRLGEVLPDVDPFWVRWRTRREGLSRSA
jgi:predicted ATPase